MTELTDWLTALEETARRATPGPLDRSRDLDEHGHCIAVVESKTTLVHVYSDDKGWNDPDTKQAEADADHIATFDRATCLRLVALVRAGMKLAAWTQQSANHTAEHEDGCPAKRVARMLRWERVNMQDCSCERWAPLAAWERAVAGTEEERDG